jgi:hypothetical protein
VERPTNAVPGPDPADPITRLEHRAHELVTDREARFDLYAAVVDVQVGSADAGSVDPDDRVVLG